ncbi:MAG TPA: type II toxin-antitoxin system PemK/MazF family toxin [Candidatus Diapherotrites archaeon]|uniref:Type II toxin-antitoxin system PemK/MazF family toxin n=1 Tax=Candidatus Iainarchaeum sp. TaxID=3101447 RepID=A0A7J4KSJ5_9ARCH|nr:type II toxin-antitoxin system PemK/MazF family toxin [Candidatus Diapherotrites archaeon]
MIIKRGDILLVNLEPVMGSEQGKIRPCIVVQNNTANQFSPTTIIVPLTSVFADKAYPTEVILGTQESGLKKISAVLCNQIRTVSKEERVLKKLSTLKPETMHKVDSALKVSLALD